MNQQEKGKVIEEVREVLDRSSIVVVTHYRGLSVGVLGILRRQMRQSGCHYRVVKNTLAKRAMAGTSFEGVAGILNGPTGLAFSADPVMPAKVLTEFSKANPMLEIRGAILNGKLLNPRDVNELAKLPSREVLIGKLLGTMNAPITNFVGVLAAFPAGLVRVLDKIRQSKEATV